MRKQFLIKSYDKLSDSNLDFKAQVIIASLTGNPNFPAPVTGLAEFTAAAELYSQRLKEAAGRYKVAIIKKNEARERLLALIRLLATYIESVCDGDLSKMASSGLTLSSVGGHSAPLEAPRDFQLQDGKNPGELKFSVKAVPYAKSYMFQFTKGPLTADSQWTSRGCSLREYTYTNLTVGDRLYCRVIVIGPRGQEVCSNTLTRIVQ